MQQFAEAGEHASAITLYLECKQALHDEFVVAPSPETEKLYEEICNGDFKSTRREEKIFSQF